VTGQRLPSSRFRSFTASGGVRRRSSRSWGTPLPSEGRGHRFKSCREANSRWDDLEPALTLTQRKTLLGQMGASGEINDVYSNSTLKLIRERLDRQTLGMTFEERYKDLLIFGTSVYDIVKNEYWGLDNKPTNKDDSENIVKLRTSRSKVKEFGCNLNAMTVEQLTELLEICGDVPADIRRMLRRKQKSDVKKIKLKPHNPEWNMQEHKGE
jgi:hypothetical protein